MIFKRLQTINIDNLIMQIIHVDIYVANWMLRENGIMLQWEFSIVSPKNNSIIESDDKVIFIHIFNVTISYF